MYDAQPSVWGALTSSSFISLSFITPTPFHFLSLPLVFSVIINKNILIPDCFVHPGLVPPMFHTCPPPPLGSVLHNFSEIPLFRCVSYSFTTDMQSHVLTVHFTISHLHSHFCQLSSSDELPEESDQFRFLHSACFVNLKGTVGLNMVKSSDMRISIPLDLSSRSFVPLPCFIHSRRPSPFLRLVWNVFSVWLCLWPSVTDESQPLSGRVMCEYYWLSALMYTPGMSVMSLLLKNRYESKRSRDFFLYKKKIL